MAADPSIVRFRAVTIGALAHLDARRQEINDLNVFPVADGDTGDNMALTLRAVIDELDRLIHDDPRSLDEIGRSEIVESVARAALLGARGNSGVILSQLIRGAAEELISRPGALVDPALLAAAVAKAAQRAYASVREPVEGTMLTVMRDMAAALAHAVAHPGASSNEVTAATEAGEQDAALAAALERAIEAGEELVRRGPELLPVLRDAGVVDAGGYAVVILFAGVVAALRGGAGPDLQHHAPAQLGNLPHGSHESETFRYCTNFAVSGNDLDGRDWAHELSALGDSVLVVGDATTIKVHVHTDEPDLATAVFAGSGEISHLDVADMHEQVAERAARLADEQHRVTGALAVVGGEGIDALFRDLGVATLDGGPTLNPSTEELLAAVGEIRADGVLLLANSPNVVMAAERAVELAAVPVIVVRTADQQSGLAGALAFDPDASLKENAGAVGGAASAARTGGVAPAARADPEGRFGVGDAVGFAGEELIAWGDPLETLAAVIETLSAEAELLTCITGGEVPVSDEQIAPLAPEGVEVEVAYGGQDSWWWLLSAE